MLARVSNVSTQDLMLQELRNLNRNLASQAAPDAQQGAGAQPIAPVLVPQNSDGVFAPSFAPTGTYAGGSIPYACQPVTVALTSQQQIGAKYGQRTTIDTALFKIACYIPGGNGGVDWVGPGALTMSAGLESPFQGRIASADLNLANYVQSNPAGAPFAYFQFEGSYNLPQPLDVDFGSNMYLVMNASMVLPLPSAPAGTPIAGTANALQLPDGANSTQADPVTTFYTRVQLYGSLRNAR